RCRYRSHRLFAPSLSSVCDAGLQARRQIDLIREIERAGDGIAELRRISVRRLSPDQAGPPRACVVEQGIERDRATLRACDVGWCRLTRSDRCVAVRVDLDLRHDAPEIRR